MGSPICILKAIIWILFCELNMGGNCEIREKEELGVGAVAAATVATEAGAGLWLPLRVICGF